MKINRISFILLCLFFSFTVLAGAHLSILSWKQEDISETQKAYLNPLEKVSVYVGKLEDPTEWDTETIEEDVLEMQKSRAEITSFFGLSDYYIGEYHYDDSDEQFFILTLSGSYLNINGQPVYFKEINIRYGHLGSQIKINGQDFDKVQGFDLSEVVSNEKNKLLTELKAFEEK